MIDGAITDPAKLSVTKRLHWFKLLALLYDYSQLYYRCDCALDLKSVRERGQSLCVGGFLHDANTRGHLYKLYPIQSRVDVHKYFFC